MLGELGLAELAEIAGKLPANMSPAQQKATADKLKSSLRKWEDTPAAEAFETAIANLENPRKK